MTKIAGRENGHGRILICLHGYGGSVLHWEKVSAELSKQFCVVTPNLSHVYMGREDLQFSKQIDLIAQYIQTQYPNQTVFLAGISYGGALAWGLASRYPDLVEKLVFINPMPPFASRHFAIPSLKFFFSLPLSLPVVYFFLASPLGKYFLRQAASVFRNLQATEDQDRIEKLRHRKLQFVAHILWKFSWLLRSEDWSYWEAQLKNWQHDCLLIYDRKDPLFTSEFYDGFAKKLASTNVVTTVDAGHISIVQQPKLIAGVMREYLLRHYYKEVPGYN
jgi:pimeloyl-ACP methyl ester carboxylesterase